MSDTDSALLENDGYILPEVGPWSVTKHQKISYYSSLFSAGMKKKWQCRVYIDLFAGAGKCRVEGDGRILLGSPLHALTLDVPFDKYFFCEREPEFMEALQARVHRYCPERNSTYVAGDVNQCVDQLLSAIPKFSKDFRGLTLCVVDPCSMSNLSFATIELIAQSIFADFLVLIPSFMDTNRNEHNYIRGDNHTVDNYLGSSEWRRIWSDPSRPPRNFGVFVAEQFCVQMERLGYLHVSLEDLELISMEKEQNLPLYYLCVFSKHTTGQRFWRETKKGTNEQLKLWHEQE